MRRATGGPAATEPSPVANRFYTVMLVPERSAAVRRLQVPKALVLGVAVLALMGFGVAGSAAVHYSYVVQQVFENHELRQENARLRKQFAAMEGRVGGMETTLSSVRRLEQKLRTMTNLSDPRLGLAVGPVEGAPGGQGPAGGSDDERLLLGALPADTVEEQNLALGILDSRLDGLPDEASRQTAALRQLLGYYEGREALLRSTPSIWPAHGWITSEFGVRDDPFTAEKLMHSGMDVATREGTPVNAPADGVVTFTGNRGGYGNLVILDHGYGYSTTYGHLSRMLVKAGDRVKRGVQIAAVGNTGRSTGPHLHYEVRIHGIPVNPRMFVLE
jgi:murein DD-endopeptidase MepM/ murein hydrolase activator NlpD